MTRDEHLAWCKKRALDLIDQGKVNEGLISMMSDMDKHEETRSPALNSMTAMMMLTGHLDDLEAARRHIEGYR